MKTPGIVPVAQMFADGMGQVHSAMMAIPNLVGMADVHTYSLAVGSTLNGCPALLMKHVPKAKRDEVVRDSRAAYSATLDQIACGNLVGFPQLGADHMDLIMDLFRAKHIHRGVHAIMSSLMISSYTVFEVMIADLWVAALNARPDPLALLQGRAAKSEGKPQSKVQEGKSLEIHVLVANKFDVSGKMGDILKDKHKFTILDAARVAYADAFEGRSVAVMAAISAPIFDLIGQLRNVIAHRNGLIDGDYVRKKVGFPDSPSYFKGLNKDDRLELDGERVSSVIRKTMCACAKLFLEVDLFCRPTT
jgi:hypothetical protein